MRKPGTGVSREDFLSSLLTKIENGRLLVPLTGAGISVGTGIPTLAGLTDYLARVRIFLRERLYIPRSVKKPSSSPSPNWRYIRKLGWPDPNDLTALVWDHLLADEENPVVKQRRMRRAVETEILDSMRRVDNGIAKRLLAELADSADLDHNLQGDHWRHLLANLTRSDLDLTDTLFKKLVEGKAPGQAHRYLAFLAPVIGFRLFLTYNFDPFIERALNQEGISATPYDIADGSPFPAPSLLNGERAVLKLHGTRFRLVADGRVHRPLDLEMRRRLAEYLPEQPLLLVLGIGGWEERVLDAVEVALEKQGTVFWLHFQSELPAPVIDRFASRGDHRFQSCRGTSPAAFLRELFERRTQSHPSIRRAYSVWGLRPLPIAHQPGEVAPDPTLSDSARGDDPVEVFTDPVGHQAFGASFDLARRVAELSRTHSPIWIDLESKNSIADVMADLIRQLRIFDTSIPPEIIPMERSLTATLSGSTALRFTKAVRRVATALGRGKYVVAFDGVADFGRPPTHHHGIDLDQRSEQAVDRDLAFLAELAEAIRTQSRDDPSLPGPRDSILLFSIGARGTHYPKLLEELSGTPSTKPPEKVSTPSVNTDALCFLSAFRIRRSHVAIATAGWNFFRTGNDSPAAPRKERTESTERTLKNFEQLRCIRPTEDGSWWMPRKLRNRLYEEFSRELQVKQLTREQSRSGKDKVILLQSFDRLIAVHCALSGYFSGLAGSSSDPWMALEGFYHRISTLRYLTRLQACLREGFLPKQAKKHCRFLSLSSGLESIFEGKILDPGKLAEARHHQLHSLATLILRKADLLRAEIPATSLLDWLWWFRVHDCRRFSLRGWKGDGREARTAPNTEESRWAGTEDSIESSIAELIQIVLRLENRLQVDKMNLVEALRTATRSLGDLLPPTNPPPNQGRPTEPSMATALRESWLAWCSTFGQENSPVSPQDWGTQDCLTLFQMARACGWAGGQAASANLCDVLTTIAKTKTGASGFAIKALALRSRADHSLIDASPWDAKTETLARYIALQKNAKKAEKAADDALRLLETVPEDKTSVVSYLLSLKGRALAILGRFGEAYSALDLSRAGLENLPAHRREVRAISLLRLAECLLLRADAALLPAETEAEEKFNLSPSGLARDKEPELQGLGPEKREDYLRLQSMGNWKEGSLDVNPAKLGESLEISGTRLARTRDLLVSAEKTLSRTRRRVEWWACLFQLQAQLEVEYLLLLTARGKIDWELPERGDQKPPISSLNHLHGSLLSGLRAVRRGLDVLLPDMHERKADLLAQDRRIKRMLCLWLKLMVCGADLATRFAKNPAEQSHEALWKPWVELNLTAGIRRLQEGEKTESWIRRWTEEERASCHLSESVPLLAARAHLINQIDRCLSDSDSACLKDLCAQLIN